MIIMLIRIMEKPVLRDVPHQLSVFQQLVGGKIEVVEAFDDSVVLVCDESGRNNGKPINRVINEHIDICGDFFLCGHDGEGLSDFPVELVPKYFSLFSLPTICHINEPKAAPNLDWQF